MLNVKILARRTTRGASLWFVDPAGPIVLVATGGAFALLDLVHPWWLSPALLVLLTAWTTRLRITADNPAVGTATTFCAFIPIRRRTFKPGEIDFSSDEWTEASKPDEISDGEWSFDCYRANEVAAWLADAQRNLAAPRASVRNPDG